MTRRPRAPWRPELLRLESRDLPASSALGSLHALARHASALVQSSTPPPTEPGPPLVPGPGQPTPIGLARSRFAAAFSGTILVGRPRYTGQSAILSYRGIGTSTQFLHGDFQMAAVLPKDASADITGAAFLQDRNQANGDQFGLDINFDKASLDSRGRPTRGTWVTDPNIYSGVNYSDVGTGTVKIRYFPDGVATVVFRGHIHVSGITNPLKNSDLYFQNAR